MAMRWYLVNCQRYRLSAASLRQYEAIAEMKRQPPAQLVALLAF